MTRYDKQISHCLCKNCKSHIHPCICTADSFRTRTMGEERKPCFIKPFPPCRGIAECSKRRNK